MANRTTPAPLSKRSERGRAVNPVLGLSVENKGQQ